MDFFDIKTCCGKTSPKPPIEEEHKRDITTFEPIIVEEIDPALSEDCPPIITLSPPTGLLATTNQLGTIQLTWNPVDQASFYEVFRDTTNEPIAITLNTGYLDTLTDTTSHTYWVRAIKYESIWPIT